MIDAAVAWTSDRLIVASLHAAIIVPLVWLVCRFVRGVPASVQAALWWLVAARLVVALLPVPSLVIPVLPPDVPAATAPQAGAQPVIAPSGRTRLLREGPSVPVVSWRGTLVTIWFVMVVVQALRLLPSFRRRCGIVRRSIPLGGDAAADFARLAAQMRLRSLPALRASAEVDVPQVAGILKPVVLVPPDFVTSLSAAEQTMALGHELMHVRRLDLALGWVPALAERLFFFHPLGRVVASEYVTAREAACDAAVLRALDVAPADYGRMLLRVGVRPRSEPLAASAGAFSTSSMRRRLEMLQHSESRIRAGWLVVSLTAACALVPLQLGARTAPVPEAGPVSQAPATAAAVVAAPPIERSRADQAPRETAAAQAASAATVRQAPAEQEAVQLADREREQLRRRADEATRMLEVMREVHEQRRTRASQDPAATQELMELARVAREASALQAELEGRARLQLEEARRQATEEFLRQQLEQLQTQQQELLGPRGLSAGHPDVHRLTMQISQYQKALEEAQASALQAELEGRARLQLEEARRQATEGSLRQQLEVLQTQQQELLRQMAQISQYQKALEEAQRRFAEEAAKLRLELRAR